MLAWSAAFGLLAGGYFAGRSDPLNLIAIFSAWAFSLVLLLIAVVRSLASSARRPSLAELAVLFGFGLMLCSVVQTPAPWREAKRLGRQAAIPQVPEPRAEALRRGGDRSRDEGRAARADGAPDRVRARPHGTSRPTRASNRCPRSQQVQDDSAGAAARTASRRLPRHAGRDARDHPARRRQGVRAARLCGPRRAGEHVRARRHRAGAVSCAAPRAGRPCSAFTNSSSWFAVQHSNAVQWRS